MHKALVKLLLILFLFTAIDPGAYATVPENTGNKQQVSVTSYAHDLSKIKIGHQRTVVEMPDYGFAKPLWVADLAGWQLNFATHCHNLFLQTRTGTFYRVLHFRKLLFPAHFFR
ncbi:hypothetical protein SAMN05216464_102448 [Mucilaginibacter pineti]|uniref:Uncharacterized protein n=1 Tax=Mucilaginibacter pineti TaxID=1391627 RepID=A0A1G6X9F5_9SPHI|nr:hypothetical protein [Mucilaginibacter pineti]SDD74728.1 hypothetical protein SAMN05216464_102448 [Mucilaginibacter pineti]